MKLSVKMCNRGHVLRWPAPTGMEAKAHYALGVISQRGRVEMLGGDLGWTGTRSELTRWPHDEGQNSQTFHKNKRGWATAHLVPVGLVSWSDATVQNRDLNR
jgi:hypothetical protein